MVGKELTWTFPFVSPTTGKDISFLGGISKVFCSNVYGEEDGVLERNLVFDVKGELFISLLLSFMTPLHFVALSPKNKNVLGYYNLNQEYRNLYYLLTG